MDEIKADSSNSTVMVIPALGTSPALKLEMKNIKYAESRLQDAKTVNPFTYSDLECIFNESYRDLKKHLSSVGYALAQAKNDIENAKADVLLGKYKEYIKEFPKEASADTRNAFLIRDVAYYTAKERIDQLEALETYLDGKIKTLENTCRYMRKQMDLILKSGLTNIDYYNTQNIKK